MKALCMTIAAAFVTQAGISHRISARQIKEVQNITGSVLRAGKRRQQDLSYLMAALIFNLEAPHKPQPLLKERSKSVMLVASCGAGGS